MDLCSRTDWKICLVVCLLPFVLLQNSRASGRGFTTVQFGPKPIWNSTYTDKLKHDLLLNYDKFARPHQHYNTTFVKIGITVHHIEVNEYKHTLSVNAWLRLEWTDEKLKWNSSNYGGIKKMNFADHEIWQPDILLYNSGTASTQLGGTHCVVNQNGEVVWVPPAILTPLCDFNFERWPFDTQTCPLKFGSWTYHGGEIDLEYMTKVQDLTTENSEWELKKIEGKQSKNIYECCPEPYADVTFVLTLVRKSPSYRMLIVTPAVVVILLTLTSFWLPPYSGEKIVLSSTTAIIISMFMLYFTQKLPAMGSHTPLIVSFYSSSLYTVGFSMIGSAVVIWLSRTRHTRPLPWVIKRPLIGSFGIYVLGLKPHITQSNLQEEGTQVEEMRHHQVTEFEEHNSNDQHYIIKYAKNPSHNDWILLAVAIDRILFCLFSFVFAILAVVYAV